MKIIKKQFKTVSAKEFSQGDSGVYIFPFKVLDPMYGRIEWLVEPIRSKRKREGVYHLEKLLVCARQTLDPRYKDKVFEIPTWAECINSSQISYKGSMSYFAGVWRAQYCEIHKNLILDSYPENNASELVIKVNSIISNDIYYR